jgi:DUF2950 family protein
MKSERRIPGRYLTIINPAIAVAALVTLGVFSNSVVVQSAAQNPALREQKPTSRSTGPQPGQQTFASVAEASQALVTAILKDDQSQLIKMLGSNAHEIISSGDDAEDKEDRDQFVQKYQRMHRLVAEPDGTTTLYVGAENWPTPIPLVHEGSLWYFDAEAGKREILYRRIGKNELTAIQVCRELVDAEKEYYAQPHDGDPNPQYAQKLFSDSGKHNGLYWETSSGEAASPMGPLVASATNEGYGQPAAQGHEPFQGYYFRILEGERTKVHGADRSYIVDGKMTRGFAFVAYPAVYRSSGVMTFLVNQDGIVYEKDLGPKTAEIVKALTRYERDASWRKAD